jgi:hypothetical protein
MSGGRGTGGWDFWRQRSGLPVAVCDHGDDHGDGDAALAVAGTAGAGGLVGGGCSNSYELFVFFVSAAVPVLLAGDDADGGGGVYLLPLGCAAAMGGGAVVGVDYAG